MESLKEKKILLTGATGGIGSAVAKLLSRSGAALFITGRNADKLHAVAADCGIPPAHVMAADITLPADVANLKEKCFSQFASPDILINAAGIGIIRNMETLSEDEFLKVIHHNLFAPFLLLKAFLPAMKEAKKGRIIHIPGVLGKTPMAGAAAYAASKYGLVGMLQSVREELKRTDIRITNIFLGGTDTSFWDHIELRVQREKMIVAEEAAKAIWFLCQQPASAVVSEMVLQPFNHQAI